MSNSYWGYWLVVFGVAIVGLMVSVNGITLTQTQDFYSLKEIADVSMLEAVDYAYYRDYNEVKIDKEKFMEVFIRMIAEVMGPNETYEVNFYKIYEAPPKVSVEVKSNSGTDFISATGYDTVSRVDAIIQIYADEVSDGDSGGGTPTPDPEPDPTPDPELPGDLEEPEDPVEDIACRTGIKEDDELTGLRAYGMTTAAILYETSEMNKSLGGITPGKEVKILGVSENDENNWAIEYDDGQCAWVKNTYMAVDIEQYAGIATNIYNASATGSKYVTTGNPITNLTGRRLYNSEYKPIAVYSFAKKLKKAAEIAAGAPYGVSLEINDAYRPWRATEEAYNKFITYLDGLDAESNIRKNVGYYKCVGGNKYTCNTSYSKGFHYDWFLATDISKHNTACAVDITIRGATMPTAMHELSAAASLYSKQGASVRTDNENVTKLYNIMRAAGLTVLQSEWWHYQDDECHSVIVTKLDKELSFWYNP